MLFSFILDSTHASNDESDGQKKSQETLERNSKDVYEGIKYIAEMVTITNRNATPKFKIDLMIRELVRLVDVFWKFFWAIIGPFWDILTLRDTINDVIEFETSKEVDDSKEDDETLEDSCKLVSDLILRPVTLPRPRPQMYYKYRTNASSEDNNVCNEELHFIFTFPI